MIFQGPKPEDSKLTNKFFDALIIDARAQAISIYYKENKQLPSELFSEFDIVINKSVTPDKNVIYSANIPTIIDVVGDKGLRVRGKGNDPMRVEYWEIIPKNRFSTIRNNVYADKNPKVSRINNTLFFMMKNDIRNAIGEGIVYDPSSLPNFDETAAFPVNSTIINLIKEIIIKLDFGMLAQGVSNDENNSVSPLSKQKNSQDQRG